MEIISLAEAKEQGLKHYFTGKPCKHGHVCIRKIIDRSCIECNKIKQKKFAHKANEWYHNNKERAKEAHHLYYEMHKEELIERARRWGEDHPEELAESKRKYRLSEKGLEQSRNWVDANKEKHAKSTKNWKDNHPDLVYEYGGTRRATKKQATPPWLTKEDREAIRAIYAEAKRRERETGIKQHVDHIIPLQHELVCGLHVPWNLQILTESENVSKGNCFDPNTFELVTT
jgi:hypothetical protein